MCHLRYFLTSTVFFPFCPTTGIVCTGVDASPGTLERALLRDSIAQIRIFCRQMGIPLRPCGSMVCLWPWDKEDRLDEVLEESLDAGDSDATRLSSQQVRSMERNLDPSCLGAVHIPGEIVVDPWLFSIAYAVHARENGAQIYTNFTMDPTKSTFDGGFWTITGDGNSAALRARAVVNAAGLWADLIQHRAHDVQPQWRARPRRGQYRIFNSDDKTKVTCPIQPVPTQRTKGIFVFASIYDQIIVGPTALDQESRTNRDVDHSVGEQLAEQARRIIPSLNTVESYVGEYVGIRPGTDKRDYQIHLTTEKHWLACAGIRSTGKTTLQVCFRASKLEASASLTRFLFNLATGLSASLGSKFDGSCDSVFWDMEAKTTNSPSSFASLYFSWAPRCSSFATGRFTDSPKSFRENFAVYTSTKAARFGFELPRKRRRKSRDWRPCV